MDRVSRDKWGKADLDVAEELVKSAGYSGFGIAFWSEEGEMLPSGIENFSFVLIDSSGKVRICDVGWDDKKLSPDESRGYYELYFEKEMSDELVSKLRKTDASFLSAMDKANLPLNDEEKKRLDWAKNRWLNGKSTDLNDYLKETDEVN